MYRLPLAEGVLFPGSLVSNPNIDFAPAEANDLGILKRQGISAATNPFGPAPLPRPDDFPGTDT